MWTSTLKKGLFLIGGLFLGGAVHAQYLRTSYFMEGASSRLQLYGAQNETYIEGWEKKTSKLLIYKRLCKI